MIRSVLRGRRCRDGSALFPVCFGCAIAFGFVASASASTPSDLTPVGAAKVVKRQTNASYQLLGTVNPTRTATLGYAVAGRVKTLHAKRGQRLAAGDPVADLQTDVIDIEIAAAEAELRLVEEQLAELQAGSRQEDIAEAKARMDAARAVSRRAASQLDRLMRLVQSNAASADEIDVATAEADSSEQLLQAATIAHQRLVAGPRQEQVAQAQARVDLQREQVKLLKDRREKHTLRAPFCGYVTQEFIEAGAWVTSGTAVIEMIELDTVEVEVAVPANQIVNLTLDQSIRVEHEQRPGELLVGTIDRIVPSAATRARTFPVLIRLDNRIEGGVPLLMNGLVVRVDLPIGKQSEMTFVPTDAIVLDGARKSVFIVDVNDESSDGVISGTVRQVPVTLGVANGAFIAVSGDLKADQWVVTYGNEGLSEGQAVEVAVDGD